jgi:hypothetical protein
MRAFVLIFGLFLHALCAAQTPAPEPSPAEGNPAATDRAPALRVRLHDLAGALANDGFKLRDRVWSGRLEGGKPARLAVNLFAGNHYWFCAAATPEVKEVKVSLFDAKGQPVETLEHTEPGLAAAGLIAPVTGEYFVQIGSADGAAGEFCLLYLFK